MLSVGNIIFNNTKLFLAPMDDVTDLPFRTICKELGADITVSEFIAADALIRDVEKTKQKILSGKNEKPFGIQLFGNEKESMCKAAQIIESHQPDFIDINWGCPARKIASKGAGSGMLKNIPLLLEITKEIVKSVNLPVTVKTRLGYDENNKCIVELCEQLQDIGVKAITIHGRTKSQMFKGESDWTLIGKAKANPNIEIPIIGNGDINSAQKAYQMKELHKVDAIMIGRAAIGNPWIFRECRQKLDYNTDMQPPTIEERVRICKKHLLLTLEHKGEGVGLLEMRKHYKPYFKGINEFKPYRIKLLTTNDVNELIDTLDEINYKFN